MAVVDNYVAKLSAKTDQAFSHYANFIGNCQVAVARLEMELEREKDDPDVIITCGTVAETVVYTALHALSQSRHEFYNERRSTIMMTWLGMFSYDTWAYDLTFYLPFTSEGDNTWERVVDENLNEALESLGVAAVSIPEEDRLQKILEYVATAQDQRRRVQPSGEAGEGGGDSARDVSDVRV